MPTCERVASCPLFAQFMVKSSLAVWKTYYCEGTFSRCERWKMAQAGKAIPANLLPNGRMLEVPLEALEAKHLG